MPDSTALIPVVPSPTRRTTARIHDVLDTLPGVSFGLTADGAVFIVEPEGDWPAAAKALRSALLLDDRDDTLIRWCSGRWIDSKTDEPRRCRRQARDGEELCAHCLDDERSEQRLYERVQGKRKMSEPDPSIVQEVEPRQPQPGDFRTDSEIWTDPCEPIAPDSVRDDAAIDAIEAEEAQRFPDKAKIEQAPPHEAHKAGINERGQIPRCSADST